MLKKSENRKKTYVADTNRLGLAGRKSGLHLFPAVDVVVVANDISLAVGQSRELVVVACLDKSKLDHLNFLFFRQIQIVALTIRVQQKRPVLVKTVS